jgi:hypothetical protein
VTLKIIDANDLQSENTALKVPCLPPYAYHRLGWITIVLFIVVNIELRPTPGLAAWAVICISITAHEQAQSNRACNIFIFVVFGGFQSSIFIFFNITVALFVSCGGSKRSPRTFNQCCN